MNEEREHQNMQAAGESVRTPRLKSSRRRQYSVKLDSSAPPLQTMRDKHVLIIGSKRVARNIQQELEGENIAVVMTPDSASAFRAMSETTIAVIAVPPLIDGTLISTCKKIADRQPKVSVFVACGPTSEATTRKLYGAGVSAVFFWPSDREPLLRTMYRLSRPKLPSRKKREPQEIALQELVTSHLKTEASVLGKHVRVIVTNRYVMLAGRVDALWKVGMAETIAGEVSGVAEVFSDAILVAGHDALTDRSIATAARQVLKHTNEVDASTLAVTVKRGVVSLAGSATSRAELQRAVEIISHVRGAQRIEDWAVVTPKGKHRDQQIGKAVRAAIAVRYPRGNAEVAVFGGIAVLSGTVKKVSERRELAALVLRQSGVVKVVDKLRVAKARTVKPRSKKKTK